MPYRDKEGYKTYQAKYYAAHKGRYVYTDKQKQQKTEYYKQNAVEISEKRKEAYRLNLLDVAAKSRNRAREFYKANEESVRGYWLKRNYGISLGQYNELFSKQGGVCAICGLQNKNGKRLHVDHDHKTKLVRGLLCSPCNLGIGIFRDSIEILDKAKAYLLGGTNAVPLLSGA